MQKELIRKFKRKHTIQYSRMRDDMFSKLQAKIFTICFQSSKHSDLVTYGTSVRSYDRVFQIVRAVQRNVRAPLFVWDR